MAAASTSFSVARRIQLNDPFPFFAGDPKTSSDTATRAPPSPSTHTHTLVAARWRREEWREVAVKLFYFELKVITFRTRRACQFFFFFSLPNRSRRRHRNAAGGILSVSFARFGMASLKLSGVTSLGRI